jgi:hypothetical protein
LPNRILREGILTSERIAKLSWPAEVFYRRLMSVVDDFGRYYATPMLLRAACYPLHLEKVSDSDIGKWIRETEEAALVRVYPAEDGKRYLELLDFRQQVRAKASKFPAHDEQMRSECVADAQQMPADAHLVVVGDVGELRSRASRLPKDWVLPEDLKAWALAEKPDWGEAYILQAAERFRDFWIAKPGKDGTKTDWAATWRNWIRNTHEPKSLTKTASLPRYE